MLEPFSLKLQVVLELRRKPRLVFTRDMRSLMWLASDLETVTAYRHSIPQLSAVGSRDVMIHLSLVRFNETGIHLTELLNLVVAEKRKNNQAFVNLWRKRRVFIS